MLTCKPTVKLILDSVNDAGDRLTTFEVHYWRPILPEMNTHRIFSRNASSSRAQSFTTKINDLLEGNIWVPEHWNAEKPGMVGGEEFDDETKEFINSTITDLAAETAHRIKWMNDIVKLRTGNEIHKQYLNRYFEPFSGVTQLISATSWDNFIKLRVAKDAMPEMHDVALLIVDYLSYDRPVKREMHLPYITEDEFKQFGKETALKVSVARCARVSYKAYNGSSELERDLRLFDRLRESGHWSPFEHVAFADPTDLDPAGHRNYKGWYQYRAFFDTSD